MKQKFKLFLNVSSIVVLVAAVLISAGMLWGREVVAAWDGSASTSFASGSGTASSPYIISTQKQMGYFMNQLNAGVTYEGLYIKLNANLDMTGGNWSVSENSSFAGVFLGNNKTLTLDGNFLGDISETGMVDWLNLVGSGTLSSPLLCYDNFGIIQNCRVTGDVSRPLCSSALLCMENRETGVVVNSCGFGSVYGSADDDDCLVGWICKSEGTIENCYTVLTLNGSASGRYESLVTGPITAKGGYENCYFDSEVIKNDAAFVEKLNSSAAASGYMWAVDSSNVNNGYPVIKKCLSAMTGLADSSDSMFVFHTSSFSVKLSSSESGYTIYYTLDGTNPTTSSTRKTYRSAFTVSGDTVLTSVAYKNGEYGVPNRQYLVQLLGSGTSTSPYIISTNKQLYAVRLEPDKVYELNRDLDFTNEPKIYHGENWESIPEFSGELRGGGHSITGLSSIYGGLVDSNTGIISELRLIDHRLRVYNTSSYFGAIANRNSGTVTRCYAGTHPIGIVCRGENDLYIGGIVGIGGTISYCSSSGIISAYSDWGYTLSKMAGIAGSGGTIQSCYSDMTLYTVYSAHDLGLVAGGITCDGYNVYDCRFDGKCVIDSYFASYGVGSAVFHGSRGNSYRIYDDGFFRTAGSNNGFYATKETDLYSYRGDKESDYPAFDFNNVWMMTANGPMPQGIMDADGHCMAKYSYTAPSCSAVGKAVSYDILNTGYRETETLPKLPHTYKVEVTEPTCNKTGLTVYTCKCGYTYNEVIEAIGYHYVKEPIYTLENDNKYPFSQADGWYTSTNKSHNTNSTFTIKVAHDCDIKIAYYVSSESNYDKLIISKNGTSLVTISGTKSEARLSLSLVAGDVITIMYKKDGSGSAGNDEAYFKIVTENQDNLIPICIVPAEDVQPTCTQAVVCSGCNAEVKPVAEHDWDNGVITTAPTHMTEGVKKYTCDCGATKTGIAEKLAEHEWDDGFITKRPTHTEEGEKIFNCPCGEFRTESVAKLTAHTWDNGVITAEPTHIAEGVKTFTCICGDTKTETIAKLTEHEWNDGEVTTAPKHTAEGVKTFTCICGDTKTEAIEKLTEHEWNDGVVTTKPTHTAEGVKTYTCTCGITRAETLEKLAEHVWDDGVVTTEPTHVTTGEKLYTCTCGITRTETLEKLPDHEWNDGVVVAANTKTYTCTGCHETKTEVITYGYCGLFGNLVWELNTTTGKLVISGNGDMQGFTSSSSQWLAYKSYIKSVVVEDGVTSIGDRAFYYCNALTDIQIAEGVTAIGNYAFMYCSSLESVDLPDSLQSIGNVAFSKCSALASIELPANVTALGTSVFADCKKLTDIFVAVDNSVFADVDGVLFTKDIKTILAYPAGKMATEYNVPNGVTMISDNAFEYASALSSLTMPSSVNYIGYYAFRYCSGLNAVKVNNPNAVFDFDVFSNSSANLVIYGYEGSTAQAYALENNHKFVAISIPEIKFNTASLSLYNDLAVNFKANKESLDASGYYNVYAVFEFCGKTYKVTDYTIDKITVSGQKVDAYVFAFKNLSPDRMTDTIKATLYATFNGTKYASATVEYSIAKYCYNQLNKITSKNALATVCVDLLNYGTESQKVTSHNLDNLANANLTEEQKSWGTQDVREFVSSTKKDQTPAVELAIWKTAALKLREDITAEMKFAADDITGLYVEVDILGRKYVYDEFGYDYAKGYYVVAFDKFTASQMSVPFTAVVRNANGEAVSQILTYSVESYTASKQNDASVGALVKAMMKYGDSAVAYGNSQN